MTTEPLRGGAGRDEGLLRMAHALERAWLKYIELFGCAPRGTLKQITAMLDLCPEARAYIELYEKTREEGMTV